MSEFDFWIEVKQGKNVKNTSRFGSQSPWVVLKCCDKTSTTKSSSTSSGTPEWHEKFSFSQSTMPVSVDVTIEVYNKRLTSTVKVGTCLASLPPYRAGDKTSQWYTVSDDDGNATGEVMLQVEWGATPAGLAGGLPSPPTPSAFGYTATPPSFGYTGSAAAGAGAGFGVGAGGGAGIAATATATATPLGPHGFPTVLDGKYTDLVLLGAGNFGRAFRAKSNVDDATYAIKLIKVQSAANLEEIKAEAKILLPLAHPHIVRYFNSFLYAEPSGQQWFGLVMEFCDSGHVNSVIENARRSHVRINDGQIGLWVLQIADALYFLHSKNVLHRDLKGDNVFLRNGVAKLADFGLAQEGGARGQAGAYAYESPEQARGEPYDGKNDVWALGCLLSELLTLKFIGERGTGAVAVRPDIINGITAEASSVHPELGALCRAMMALDPRARPTAQQIVQQLQPKKASFEARLKAAPVSLHASGAPGGAVMTAPVTAVAPTAAAAGAGGGAGAGGAPQLNPREAIRLTCVQCGTQMDTKLSTPVCLCYKCHTAIGHAACSGCRKPLCFAAKGIGEVQCPHCRARTNMAGVK